MDDTQHPAPRPAPAPEPSPDGLSLPAAGHEPVSIGDEPLSISTAEDILAYIPHALGEWPHESLVLVCLGERHLGPTLRIDLPGRRGPSTLGRFAETVAEYAVHGMPAGCVIAVYSEAVWADPALPPHREVVDAVVARLADSGVPTLETWVVGRDTWRTSSCTDALCCAWPGQTLASLRDSRVEAEMVYRGSSYGARDLLDVVPHSVPVAAPAGVAAALEACIQDPEQWWDPWAFTSGLAAWEEILAGEALPDASRLRLLAATVMRPALRDAVLVASASDAATAWHNSSATGVLRAAGLAGEPPALPGGLAAPAAAALFAEWSVAEPLYGFGEVLMGETGAAPSWGRIARLERVALSLARMEEPEVRAPALSMLAWVSWARGRGGKALAYLDRALMVDPEYRLAQLLSGFVQKGRLAAWALCRETAWTRAEDAA